MSALVLCLADTNALAQKGANPIEKCGQADITSRELEDEKFARSFYKLQEAVINKRVSDTSKEIPLLSMLLTVIMIWMNLKFKMNSTI